MSRMNNRLRQKAYKLCAERDGEKCIWCKRIPVAKVEIVGRHCKRLVVHHKDGNPENNPRDGSNWALACQACNIEHGRKSLRGVSRYNSAKNNGLGERGDTTESRSRYNSAKNKALDMSRERERESERERERQSRRGIEEGPPIIRSMEMAKAQDAEPFFRHYVRKRLQELGKMTKRSLLNGGAEAYFKLTGRTISQQALSRYLDKMLDPLEGEYMIPEADPTQSVTKRPF